MSLAPRGLVPASPGPVGKGVKPSAPAVDFCRLAALFTDPETAHLLQRQSAELERAASQASVPASQLQDVAAVLRNVAQALPTSEGAFTAPLCKLLRVLTRPFHSSKANAGAQAGAEIASLLAEVASLLLCGDMQVEITAAEVLTHYALGSGEEDAVRAQGLLRAAGVLPAIVDAFQAEVGELLGSLDVDGDGKIDEGEYQLQRNTESGAGSRGVPAVDDAANSSASEEEGDGGVEVGRDTARAPAFRSTTFLETLARLIQGLSVQVDTAKALIRQGAAEALVALLDIVHSPRQPIVALAVETLWNLCEHSTAALYGGDVALSLPALLRKHRSENACFLLATPRVLDVFTAMLHRLLMAPSTVYTRALRNEVLVVTTLITRMPVAPPAVSAAPPPSGAGEGGGALLLSSGMLPQALLYGTACEMGLPTPAAFRSFGTSDEADLEFKCLLWDLLLAAVLSEEEAVVARRKARAEVARRDQLLALRRAAKGDSAAAGEGATPLPAEGDPPPALPVLQEVAESLLLHTLLCYLDPAQAHHPYIRAWTPAQRRKLELHALSLLLQLAPRCLDVFGAAGGPTVLTLYLRAHAGMLSVRQVRGGGRATLVGGEDEGGSQEDAPPLHPDAVAGLVDGEDDADRVYLALRVLASTCGAGAGHTTPGVSVGPPSAGFAEAAGTLGLVQDLVCLLNSTAGAAAEVMGPPPASRDGARGPTAAAAHPSMARLGGGVTSLGTFPTPPSSTLSGGGVGIGVGSSTGLLPGGGVGPLPPPLPGLGLGIWSSRGGAGAAPPGPPLHTPGQSSRVSRPGQGLASTTESLTSTALRGGVQAQQGGGGVVASMGGACTPLGHVVEAALAALSSLCRPPQGGGDPADAAVASANQAALREAGGVATLLTWLKAVGSSGSGGGMGPPPGPTPSTPLDPAAGTVTLGPKAPSVMDAVAQSAAGHADAIRRGLAVRRVVEGAVASAQGRGGDAGGVPSEGDVFGGGAGGGEQGLAAGPPCLLPMLVTTLWCAVEGSPPSQVALLSGGGVETLLDIAEGGSAATVAQVAGLLADLLAHPSAAPYLRAWRSDITGTSAVGLFLRLWAAEEQQLGVPRGSFGELPRVEGGVGWGGHAPPPLSVDEWLAQPYTVRRPLDAAPALAGMGPHAADGGGPTPHLTASAIMSSTRRGPRRGGGLGNAFDRLREALRAGRMWAQGGGGHGPTAARGVPPLPSLGATMRQALDLRPKLFCVLDAIGLDGLAAGAGGDFACVAADPAAACTLEVVMRYKELVLGQAWDRVASALAGRVDSLSTLLLPGGEGEAALALACAQPPQGAPLTVCEPIEADGAVMAARLSEAAHVAATVRSKHAALAAAAQEGERAVEEGVLRGILSQRQADEHNASLAVQRQVRRAQLRGDGLGLALEERKAARAAKAEMLARARPGSGGGGKAEEGAQESTAASASVLRSRTPATAGAAPDGSDPDTSDEEGGGLWMGGAPVDPTML